jgi:hypothetical protein
MIARAGSGWQYLLADLSLILFMITAAALSQAEDAARTPASAPVAAAREAPRPSPQGEALAVYRAEPGAPPLAEWLGAQSADARQQLTIVARFAPGRQGEALAEAGALAREAGEMGLRARIVVEPGPPSDPGGTSATLAFDVPQVALAARR